MTMVVAGDASFARLVYKKKLGVLAWLSKFTCDFFIFKGYARRLGLASLGSSRISF